MANTSQVELGSAYGMHSGMVSGMLSGLVGRKGHMPDKVRENRLRAMAARRGLELQKSRRRDPGARDYGHWWVRDDRTRRVVFPQGRGGRWGATLNEVEAYLTERGEAGT